MARSWLGGGTSDFLFETVSGALRPRGGVLTFWSAQSGGLHYTDLLLGGIAVSAVRVGSEGLIPAFQGPDGVAEMWAQRDGDTTRRWRVTPRGGEGPAGPPGASIKGDKGDPGERGPQGLPGPNAVPTDEAMAAALGTQGTQSNAAITSLDGPVARTVREELIPLEAANAFGSLWNTPQAVCDPRSDLTFAAFTSAGGDCGVIEFDPTAWTARKIVAFSHDRRDDHNADSVLIEHDRPGLVTWSAHDVASELLSRKQIGRNGISGDGSLDSLQAALPVGGTVPGSQVTTYSPIFRKPGTSILLTLCRVAGTHWRWAISTNYADSWQTFNTNAMFDFTGTVATPKGYMTGLYNPATNRIEFYLYNNPAQALSNDAKIYRIDLDWTTEKWIHPDGTVLADLRNPTAPINVATSALVVHTEGGGRRIRLSHAAHSPNGIDVHFYAFAAASGTVTTNQVRVLERTGPSSYTARTLPLGGGDPFGGVGNAPYFGGLASPNPGYGDKKMLYQAHSAGGVHRILRHTVTASWAETPVTEVLREGPQPYVRLACPVRAQSIPLVFTRVQRYGNGYGDPDADINFIGTLGTVTHPKEMSPNIPPIASLTTSVAGMVVTANASGSLDLDGTIATYAWNWGDGTTSSGVTATRTYTTPGTYTVTLTVTDNEGATSVATASVTVAAVSLGARSNADVASGTSLTWSHTVSTGDTVLCVFVPHNNAGGAEELPSSVTYGGAAMTLLDSAASGVGSTSGRVGSVWWLANPTVGTADVVITKTTAVRMIGFATSIRGAATTPGTIAKDVSNTARTGATTTTTSPATSLVVVWTFFAGVGTATAGSGGTMVSSKASSTTIQANLSTFGGGASVSQTVTYPTSALVGQIAVPVLSAT